MISMIILIGVGIIGMVGIIWLTQARIRSIEFPVQPGKEWFRVSPERIEEMVSMKMREHFRSWLKILLIWMLGIYRKVSRKITVKQVLKKKVREFLYEHTPDSIRHPSEFWHKVRHHEKTPHAEIITEEIIEIELEKEIDPQEE